MKVKFETEINKCTECPFCYYYSDNHELCGVYFCKYREMLGENYAFADEKGIHKNCPFLKKNEEN